VSDAAKPSRHLDAAWTMFEADVLDPAGVSAIQRSEMRMAFMAGAHAATALLTEHVDPGDLIGELDTFIDGLSA
jgi:hypothetical protein